MSIISILMGLFLTPISTIFTPWSRATLFADEIRVPRENQQPATSSPGPGAIKLENLLKSENILK